MSITRWTFLRHVVISIVVTIIAILSNLISSIGLILMDNNIPIFGGNQASSIAIIGGADGPTAFYTTINFSSIFEMSSYFVLFLILVALYKPFCHLLNKVFL